MGKRVGVVIGRMQGFHNDHLNHILRAAASNDVVMVLLGSSNRRISIKNPFTFDQRVEMIQMNLVAVGSDHKRVIYRPLPDFATDVEWLQTVHHIVAQQANPGDKVTLYGSDKDDSTYYLNMFPGWNKSFTPALSGFDATTLRKAWFTGYQTSRAFSKIPHIAQNVSGWTIMYLDALKFNADLQDEWTYYQNEAASFTNYPFPETLNFSCADCVFTWQDYVAFITRARSPGKGCKALPGGFRNRGERYRDAAEREAYEETRINISPATLAKCYRGEKLFDDGSRSLGIPRETVAFHFDLTEMFDEKPILYPADDAADYEWIHKKHLDDRANEIYDDHLFIVKHFV